MMNFVEKTDQYGDFKVKISRGAPEKPLISVIMSVYNGGLYLGEAIESVLKQTFANFEFVIINDGSEDDSLEITQKYQKNDKRIILIDQENIGLTKSLNRGIGVAKGDFIARMDADDISLPDRFEKQLKIIEDKNADILGCLHKEIHEGGVLCDQHVKKVTGYITKNVLFKLNPLFHSSVLIRRSSNPRYNDNWRYAQDYEFYLSLIGNSKLYNDEEVLVHRRYVEGMISQNKNVEQRYYALLARYRHLFANLAPLPF